MVKIHDSLAGSILNNISQDTEKSLFNISSFDKLEMCDDYTSPIWLEEVYANNVFIQKIILLYPSEMVKKFPSLKHTSPTGLTLSPETATGLSGSTLQEREKEYTNLFHTILEKLDAASIIKDSLVKTNIYGSYLLFLKTNVQKINTPINSDEEVIELIPYPFHLTDKITKLNNGVDHIEYYVLDNKKIHHSRVIRFDSTTNLNQTFCAPSLLKNIYPYYVDYLEALKTTRQLANSHSSPILKLKDLVAKLGKNPDTRNNIKERMLLVQNSLQHMNPIAIDKEQEELEYVERSLSGVKELVEISRQAFIGATDIPEALLFGFRSSGGGLSDTGLWERTYVASRTRTKQLLLNNLYLTLIRQNLNIDNISLYYPETLELTPLEKAEMDERLMRTEKLKQEALNIQLQNNLLLQNGNSPDTLNNTTSIRQTTTPTQRIQERDRDSTKAKFA